MPPERARSKSDPNFFYFAHELTWEEVVKEAASRQVIVTIGDDIISSRDVKFDQKTAWHAWLNDVAYAPCGQNPRTLRPEVEASYKQYEGQMLPPGYEGRKLTTAEIHENIVEAKAVAPRLELVSPQQGTVGKLPPKFTWSLTALMDFESCGKYFAHKKYHKDLPPEPDSYHLVEGRMLHDEADRCLRKRVLSTDTTALKCLDGKQLGASINPYIELLLRASEGHELISEFQMCITEQMQSTAYKDWTNGWGRGGIDVLIVKPDQDGVLTASLFDWKTGKRKDEDLQLLLYCAFLSLHRPDIEQFKAKYIWLKSGEISGINPAKPQVITKEMIPIIWASVLKRVKRMQEAWTAGVFNASPGPLCNWRSCSKTCPYK